MSKGFIKISREILDLCKPEKPHKYTEREALLWLVENAAYGEYNHHIFGKLQAGDIPTNMRHLRKVWGWEHRQLKTFLQLLNNNGFIDWKITPANTPAITPDLHQVSIRLITENNSSYTRVTPANTPANTPNKEEGIKEEGLKEEDKNTMCGSDFEEFYKNFPRKTNRKEAEKSYNRALKKVTHLEIMQGLAILIKEWQQRPKADFKYCPHPATWLNKERWDNTTEEIQNERQNNTNAKPKSWTEAITRIDAEEQKSISQSTRISLFNAENIREESGRIKLVN